MAESRKVSNALSQSSVHSVLSDSVDPKSLKRKSSMMGYHSDIGTDVKIELKAPQKTTLTTVLKKEEKHVDGGDRFNRIANTDRLLKNNNAITDAERAWLKDLGKNHNQQYRQLGAMLTVNIFRHGRRHGVSGTENRNKIRMQILKAAVHEAMKTASSDVTAGDKKRTINNALKAAQETRSAMFKSVGFKLRKVRAYNEVTTETVQNPDTFKAKYDRKLANLELYSAVQWPRSTLSSGISWSNQKRTRAAVEVLVNNDLLTADAASTLLRRLREEPDNINQAFSDLTPRVEPKAEREKVRAMALLALAYNDANTAKQIRYHWLPDLPRSGVPSQPGRDMQPARDEWLDWAKQVQKPDSRSFSIDYDSGDDGDDENTNFDSDYDSDYVDMQTVPEQQINLNPSGMDSDYVDMQTVSKQQINLNPSGINVIEPQATPGGKPFEAGDLEYKGDVEEDGSSSGDSDYELTDPKDVEDLYTSDSDDDDKPLDETKVTAEQKIKLTGDKADGGNGDYSLKPPRKQRIVLTGDEPLNAEDNDNNTDKDSSIHSLNYGQLVDGTGKEKSPSQNVNPDSGDEYVHSLPVVLELNDKNDDDNKLVNAMGALRNQQWPQNPLGPNPLLEIPRELTHANQELTDNLLALSDEIGIVLDTYELLQADKDNKRTLNVQPGVAKQIAIAVNDAKTAKAELKSLKDSLDTSDILKTRSTPEQRQEFGDKITPVIGQLDDIIQRCGLVLERIRSAQQEKAMSLNANNNNNVQ